MLCSLAYFINIIISITVVMPWFIYEESRKLRKLSNFPRNSSLVSGRSRIQKHRLRHWVRVPFHQVTQRKTLNKCLACSCMELMHTASAGLTFQQFFLFLIVTALLLPVYLIPAMCTDLTIFSFPRSPCSTAILCVTKLSLKNVWKFPPHAAKPEFREPNRCKTHPTGRSHQARSWFLIQNP